MRRGGWKGWVPAGACALLLTLMLSAAAAARAAAPYEPVQPATLAKGAAIPAPSGPVVLTVRGAVRHGTDGGPLRFDRATLERLGTVRFTSRNRWYDDPVTYEGVLGSALLDAVGVPPGATRMHLRALNDYSVSVPISDFRTWPVLLALKLNGTYMSERDKGPIWVVYPNHLDPKLGDPMYQARWIWQLAELRFE